jgi:cell division septation protein DedD
MGTSTSAENKKVLWIVLSVTLFIAVVLFVGMFLFYPDGDRGVADAGEPAGEAGAGFDAIEWVRTGEEPPGLEEPAEKPEDDDMFVVIGEAERPDEPDREPEPSPAAEAEAETVPAPRETPPREETKPTARPAARTTAARAPAEKPAEAKPKPRTVRVSEYWIQAGSYKSRFRAEETRENLEETGITARIFSKTVGGENYFRVRIGPYQDKQEAAKFLAWVKDRTGFEESYISVVYRTETVDP